MLPMILAVLGGGYVVKKAYDFITEDSDDGSYTSVSDNRAERIRQAQEREALAQQRQAEQRRRQEQSRMLVNELNYMRQQFLEVDSLPSSIEQEQIEEFAELDVNNINAALYALNLLGVNAKLKKNQQEQRQLEQELDALMRVEQQIKEV